MLNPNPNMGEWAMEWDELRSRFDRLYGTEAPDAGLAGQSIDAYQTELLKLYDRWAGVLRFSCRSSGGGFSPA